MGTVYSGIVGQHVLPSIRAAARSLDIVSPYLSPEYAQLLLLKAKQGVTVCLITSDSNGDRHQQALRMLGGPTGGYFLGSRFWRYLALGIAFGLSGIVLHDYAGLWLLAFSLVVVIAGFLKSLARRQVSTGNLSVKIVPSTRLIHVKLYIIDRQVAFTGSANLTYYGMNKNIERIEMKTIPSEVQTEMAVFSSIWGPRPVVPPTGIPSTNQQPLVGNTTETAKAITREEVMTLERLYKNFQPSSSSHGRVPGPAAPSMGPSAKTGATWQKRLLSRLHKMFS